MKIKIRKSFRLLTRKLQRDEKVGRKIRDRIDSGGPSSEYMEFQKKKKDKGENTGKDITRDIMKENLSELKESLG